MNSKTVNTIRDFLLVCGAASFFVGCIASTHRGPNTLAPKQTSLGASYLKAKNLEESDSEPVQLVALDARIGLEKGVDAGIAHTWDISKNNENAFATVWGDIKFQVSNKENKSGRPIFSFAIQKGYIYDEEIDTHITSIPLMLGFPVNENVTPFLLYKHELFSEGFIPEILEGPRRTFALGVEMNLRKPESGKWTPKMGICLGRFNALEGGDDYQICCTVAPRCRAEIERWNREHPDCRLTPIGEITDKGYSLRDGDHLVDLAQRHGYRHFD